MSALPACRDSRQKPGPKDDRFRAMGLAEPCPRHGRQLAVREMAGDIDMTMKVAITNLANRTGDVLVVEDADHTIRLKRGESTIIDSQHCVSFSLMLDYSEGDDEYIGTPNFLVSDPPRHL